MNTKEYLSQKGIEFRENGGELITKCLFAPCDNDSRGNEAHLYFDAETGQYNCKKCGTSGNLITLAKFLGDVPAKKERKKSTSTKFNTDVVESCHLSLPDYLREYLNERGIINEVIDKYKLGYKEWYKKEYITIPIKDVYGNWDYFKFRQDPNHGDDKTTSTKGVEAQLYDWGTLKDLQGPLVVCEGEFDCLALISKGIPAVTSTHGAATFKDAWADKIRESAKEVYICFDNDEPGRRGAQRAAEKIWREDSDCKVFIVTLPKEVGEHGDITDYFVKLNGSVEDLFEKHAMPYPERIDISQFSPLTTEELVEVLGLTIKHDRENKVATFLCELSAYTEDSQFNVSYNAPSSTGKSYIPTEIAKLFPEDDVMEIAYCSPTAFFHDAGEFDKESNTYFVDLAHKIIIFLDQPHNDLLARLRPLLSHDKKEITLKITDKNQKGGNRTKNVVIKGYPSVIFCTAGLEVDEQEATRFLLLSPEINQEKIREGISAAIRKEADGRQFSAQLEMDEARTLLKERIRAIKLEKIQSINIPSSEKVKERYLQGIKKLKPRHQRDIKRLLAIAKVFALLNLWWRDNEEFTIIANDEDVEEAFKLWDKLSVSQELNLPPYVYGIYEEIILPVWREKKEFHAKVGQKALGLERKEILKKHYAVYGRMLDVNNLRLHILPMLETAGLITQEPDPDDRRKWLICPVDPDEESDSEKNSENEGGVDSENDDDSEIF